MPPILLSGSGRLALHILLGSAAPQAPLAYGLGEISVPNQLLPPEGSALTASEKRAREEGFYGWPAQHHTFAVPASETMPPAVVSIAFGALTLGLPWALLLSLVGLMCLSLHLCWRKRATDHIHDCFGTVVTTRTDNQ